MIFCGPALYDGTMRTRLLVVGIVGAALAGCGDNTAPRSADPYRNLPADYVMGGVRHYLTEDGIRRGVLNADSAYFYNDSAKAHLRKVHLVLYNAAGQEAADLTSKAGQLDQRTNVMLATGNVVLVAQGASKRIETEELHYDPNEHRVWSTVSSTITQQGTRLTTQGFTADDQLTNIQMKAVQGKVSGMKVNF